MVDVSGALLKLSEGEFTSAFAEFKTSFGGLFNLIIEGLKLVFIKVPATIIGAIGRAISSLFTSVIDSVSNKVYEVTGGLFGTQSEASRNSRTS